MTVIRLCRIGIASHSWLTDVVSIENVSALLRTQKKQRLRKVYLFMGNKNRMRRNKHIFTLAADRDAVNIHILTIVTFVEAQTHSYLSSIAYHVHLKNIHDTSTIYIGVAHICFENHQILLYDKSSCCCDCICTRFSWVNHTVLHLFSFK